MVLGDRWFIGSMVVHWGWVPVLMVADWGGFIIDLGFFFSSSHCCGGVGGYCGDLKCWVLVAKAMMAFFLYFSS